MPGVVWHVSDLFAAIDRAGAYPGTYEPWLVATSILIAILAAFVALSISARMAAATSWQRRWTWAGAGAVSMGGGIWAMHFIGMLAFSLPCGVSYDPFGTLLSMLPGILASGVALDVISRKAEPNLKRLGVGAVLMGAGIGGMHYSGMAAMHPAAELVYDPALVALSVVVAVVLAFVSLGIRAPLRRAKLPNAATTLASASVMGCAVAGMHYTAMQASLFYPLLDAPAPGALLPATELAILIAFITVLIAVLMLVATFAGRQTELAADLRAEAARRHALEQRAEGGRARLQAIFDAVADAIVSIGADGRILQWSSGAQRIFGYAPEQIIGTDLTTLLPEPHRSRHSGDVPAFLKTCNAKLIGIGRELTALRMDGTEFPIELAASEVHDSGELFFTAILRDITERKRVETDLVRAREQAEAANTAKSQFLATMSHEIRTPINGVLGMANLLASTPLNGRQRHLVGNLTRSGQALRSIINDILDFSKIEAGRFELFAAPFDLRETIAELTDLFAERSASKGLEFVYFVAEEVPPQLIGDQVRLRQVLVNLIGNALKFTEQGEIVLDAAVSEVHADHVVLAFIVTDTGIGIDPEQHARVFESFHQIDGSMTRARGGSGLGLAISKQLVELMHGSISVDSALGRGARFRFTCRFKLPAEPAPPPVARHIARPLRVLLADTNATSARVMSTYLTNWQIDATVVMAAAEATDAWTDAVAAGEPYDVAILDVGGLGEAGIKLAHSIRTGSAAPRNEVVLLTGLGNRIADDRLERIGAAAILTKPVRPSALFDALASIAAGSGPREPISCSSRPGRVSDRQQFAARVLVAEDNLVNQEVAMGTLESLGCQVVTAPNGSVAVARFADEHFDLVLMDCEMPIMDGLEATRRIRAIEMAAGTTPPRRTPIIAVTAHALDEVREKCLAADMDAFLVKPFDERQMADTLRRWLVPNEAAETPPATNAATIDAHVIDGLRRLDRDGTTSRLLRVVTQFGTLAPTLAADIRENATTGDTEALWKAAHSLKSSAGALGATQLSKLCADIEAAARHLGVERARPLVDAIEHEVAAAVRGLHALTGETHVPV